MENDRAKAVDLIHTKREQKSDPSSSQIRTFQELNIKFTEQCVNDFQGLLTSVHKEPIS